MQRPAVMTSLLVTIRTVFHHGGSVMVTQTVLIVLMRKDVWLQHVLSQFAQGKCSVVLMEPVSKVTGIVMEKRIALMDLMSNHAVSYTYLTLSFFYILFLGIGHVFLEAWWSSLDPGRLLRWLDWIFLGGYPNYVAMIKDMGKRLLPLYYYIKMKISYDLGFILQSESPW